MSEGKLVKLFHERIAKITIGASSIRSRPKNTKMIIEGFLRKLDLGALASDIDEDRFRSWLDKETASLQNQLIERLALNDWGLARKAVNIFLLHAQSNRLLAKEYNLRKIENFLEVPLDSKVVKGLRKEAKGSDVDLPKGRFTIKALTPKDSDKFQEFAKELAKKRGFARVYLDLEYW